jgi:subtilisin-like proprotein convertase family protein
MRLAHLPLLLFLPCALHAASVIPLSHTESFSVALAIPDNHSAGIADTRWISTTEITRITSVQVSLRITGGWNGDFFAYLRQGEGFAVLLNRPGRSADAPFGSGSSGMEIDFHDEAPSDVHLSLPAAGPAAGVFQPDARTTDPAEVISSDLRSAFLASFHGFDPNGPWTLFIADLSTGDEGRLESWTLHIQGVPEPGSATLLLLSLILLARHRR